jgi:hypothetical protein
MYAFGGDAPGSACGEWLTRDDLEKVWYGKPPALTSNDNYNWTVNDFTMSFLFPNA